MKTKYNTHFSMNDNQTEQHNSYAQAFLFDEISCLLAPSARQITGVPVREVYIHNPEMEKILARYKKHTYNNNTCIIEGLTGTGKSMLVEYVFEIEGMSCKVIDNSIVIPFNFDGTQYDKVSGTFTRMVKGACDCLLKEFPNLRPIDDHAVQFFKFIANNRQDIIPYEKFPTPPVEEQLQDILNNNALGFYSSALKFYLSQTDICSVNNVILVIDDIEGIRLLDEQSPSAVHELLPIKVTLEFIECMQNPGNGPVPWSLNSVICCRHYVSRLMKSLPYSLEENTSYIAKIAAYSVCERYDLRDSPKIMDIIRKRYDAICKREHDATDRWRTAMGVVVQLIEKIDNRMMEFILNATLGNIREAFIRLKHIVLNKRWIQRDCALQKPGAFSIRDIEQYEVTPTTLMRAFCMNESMVYNSTASFVPNLLCNTQNNDMELIVLLTLKYFLRMADYRSMAWDANLSISDFKTLVRNLFNSDKYSEAFVNAVYYLIEHRLLLRSYDQEQIDNTGLTRHVIEQVECVYLSKLGADLWSRLGSTSVFFEMFVDDIWLEDDPRQIPKQQFRGFDIENFSVALNYMYYLIDAEHMIYARSKNVALEGVRFEDVFGEEPVCLRLLDGLEKSLNAFYRQPDVYMEHTLTTWRNEIGELRDMCKKIYSDQPNS